MPHTKKQVNLDLYQEKLFKHYHDFIKKPMRTSKFFYQISLKQLSSKPFEAATSLCRLRDRGIPLTQENIVSVVTHDSPFDITSAFIQLHDSRLLTLENKRAVQNHTCPDGIARILRLLQSVKLLTPENIVAIQEKNDLHSITGVFFKLYYADLFTQKNFNNVLEHPHPVTLNNLLRRFDRQNILTQTIFEQLLRSQQEKNSWTNGYTKAKKLSIPTQSSPYLAPNYNCGPYANFFPAHKRRHEQKFSIKTIEFNKQIGKK